MKITSSTYPEYSLTAPQKKSASAGWMWINEGVRYVIQSKKQWFLLFLFLGSFFTLSRFLPPILQVAMILIFPFFASGIATGCNDIENSKELRPTHLFAGFSNPNAKNIFRYSLIIFMLFIVAQMLSSMIMVGLGYSPEMIESSLLELQKSQSPGVSKLFESELMVSFMLVSLVTLLPIMAIQFLAPIVLTFTKWKASQAVIASLKATMINIVPLLSYLICLVLAFVLPIMTYNFLIELIVGNAQNIGFVGSLVILLLVFGTLSLIMAVAYSSAYVAFKDIFMVEENGVNTHS